MKNWKFSCFILLIAVALCACERAGGGDARKAFLGDYTFVSNGDIDLYAGAVKVVTVPLDKEGEMSIVPADKSNTVWIVAENDSALAYVSDSELFMESTTDTTTIGGISMEMSYTYGKASLVENKLSWSTDVVITATYKAMTLSGKGTVDIVATKK